MKLVLCIFALLSVAACSKELPPEYFERALHACDNNGGVKVVLVDTKMAAPSDILYKVTCVDGAVFYSDAILKNSNKGVDK